MAAYPILDRQTTRDRLYRQPVNPFENAEEDEHKWGFHFFRPPIQRPLLRVWDQFSGSQPEEDDRLMARDPEMRLDDKKSRKDSLASHLNHSCWSPTPYISFTASPSAVKDIAEKRIGGGKRGTQTLTVIDPDIRLRDGLPVLHVLDEIDHYDIPAPYKNGKEYCENHYICLWQVREAEVIGHWDWIDLTQDENWYENTILPAYQKFVSRNTAIDGDDDQATGLIVAESVEDIDDLNRNFSCLFGGCAVSTSIYAGLTVQVATDPSDCGESYTSEELDYGDHNQYDWDTDDEVEENNAADDMLNMLEGDW